MFLAQKLVLVGTQGAHLESQCASGSTVLGKFMDSGLPFLEAEQMMKVVTLGLANQELPGGGGPGAKSLEKQEEKKKAKERHAATPSVGKLWFRRS